MIQVGLQDKICDTCLILVIFFVTLIWLDITFPGLILMQHRHLLTASLPPRQSDVGLQSRWAGDRLPQEARHPRPAQRRDTNQCCLQLQEEQEDLPVFWGQILEVRREAENVSTDPWKLCCFYGFNSFCSTKLWGDLVCDGCDPVCTPNHSISQHRNCWRLQHCWLITPRNYIYLSWGTCKGHV